MFRRARLKVHVYDFRGKARRIAAALREGGARLVDDPSTADVVLVNHDNPAVPEAVERAEKAKANGGRVVVYPDGGGVPLVAAWDGLWPVADYVDAMLVSGPGKAEVCRRYGYPRPVKAVGWTLSDVAPRNEPVEVVSRVLFAPSHPPCLEHSLRANARLYSDLCALLDAGTFDELVVRHLDTPGENGLEPHAPSLGGRISFERGTWDDFGRQTALIDSCDVVVTGDPGTFAALAVARGRPVVMCDSARTDLIDHGEGRRAENESAYRDYIRYPFDAADGELGDLIREATADVDDQRRWSADFVGGDLDPVRLMDALRD